MLHDARIRHNQQNNGDGLEHFVDTTRGKQRVDKLRARIRLGAPHHSAQKHRRIDALVKHGFNRANSDTRQKRRNRRHLKGDANNHDHKRNERHGANIERTLQPRKNRRRRRASIARRIKAEADNGIDSRARQAQDNHQRKEPLAQRKHVDLGDSGRQIWTVDQGRYNLAHIRRAHNGARRHAERHIERRSDADERQANGAGGAPCAHDNANHERRQEAHRQEQLRRNHLKPVINHRGHRARQNPNRDHNANANKNQARFHRIVDALLHGIENFFPIKPQVQRDKARNHAADEHGNLRIGSQPHNAAEHYRRKQAEGEHPVAKLRLFFRFLCHNANPHAPRTGHSKKRPHALLAYASFSHFPYMFALQ